MSDDIQTYQMSGGVGLALMAMILAADRKSGLSGIRFAANRYMRPTPFDRRCTRDIWFYPLSAEYYAIIDRISRGEQP
jgi:hypothetical protein